MLKKLPLDVYVLSVCLGLAITTAVMSVTVSAIAAKSIINNDSLSTLPYGFQFLAIILLSYILAKVMEKKGRAIVSYFGASAGVISGILGLLALKYEIFLLLLVSHFCLGILATTANFYRFAILDIVDRKLESYAMNFVLLGGVIAAILGPTLTRNAERFFNLNLFQSVYLMISLVSFVIFVLLLFVKFPKKPKKNNFVVEEAVVLSSAGKAGVMEIIKNKIFLLAVSLGACAYALMNIIMISSTVYLINIGVEFANISWFIQTHVLMMFLPSLFSGYLIKKLSISFFILIGILFQLATNINGLVNIDGRGVFISLFLLGLSWNFLYVGGSYIIGESFRGKNKFIAQGLNDSMIHVFTTISTFSAGMLLAILGWQTLNAISIFILSFIIIFYLHMRKSLSRIS